MDGCQDPIGQLQTLGGTTEQSRANNRVPPWRYSVTHKIPLRSSTKRLEWNLIIVATTEQSSFSRPEGFMQSANLAVNTATLAVDATNQAAGFTMGDGLFILYCQHKNAELFYNVSPENIRKLANEFYREMDQNDDGQVSLQEPFCDGCGVFINGMFFTCAECFGKKTSTFNVCVDCLGCGSFVHNHKNFVDNFFLLESKRKAGLSEVKFETRQTKNGWGRAFETLKAAVEFVAKSCSIIEIALHLLATRKFKEFLSRCGTFIKVNA
ncbi:hypothetical protein FNV43_RR02230 [Rhamnella rubrinervis]|uniref:EF-hand domain-containing protein n=1 Tax=Rhamnella rubrinervis TaxID=2594499 RepID=A0A8K0HRA1_9ROSA|nr:hypothetical protein FNV43_RR02230 [Rhamnella rubrinervis]